MSETTVRDLSTPHDRGTARIVAALDDMGLAGREDLARGLHGIGGYEGSVGKDRVLLLAVTFSFGELDALRVAMVHSKKPKMDWRRHISKGKHARYECLERPEEWCSLGHPGRCDSCPTLRPKAATVKKVLYDALELRREIDAAMWGGR